MQAERQYLQIREDVKKGKEEAVYVYQQAGRETGGRAGR